MAPAVLFGDVEAQAIAYLQAALDARDEAYTTGVNVTNLRSTGREVVIRRDGGPRLHLFEQPRLGINVWAESDEVVTDLALMVAALFMAWPDGQPVTSARQLSGPSAVPEEGVSRRFLSIEVVVRGVQLVPA